MALFVSAIKGFPHSTSGQTALRNSDEEESVSRTSTILDWKFLLLKLGNRGVGEDRRGFGLYSNLLRKLSNKSECVWEKKRGRVRVDSAHKRKLRQRGKHTSQLGRQWSRKAPGEDPPPPLPPLSRIHLSPNPFPYFTDNNKERALGA